jgi:hypothetical protein
VDIDRFAPNLNRGLQRGRAREPGIHGFDVSDAEISD